MVKSSEQPGLHHVAFTFASMGELLDNYVRLRERGIRPFFCVNHGPTTSMYYADPDGNRVELLVDNFPSVEEAQAWMRSAEFARNPIGVDFDPDEHVRKFDSGVAVSDLVLRDGGEGDVLLDMGGVAGPLRMTMAEDQFVIGQRSNDCHECLGHDACSSLTRSWARSRLVTTSR